MSRRGSCWDNACWQTLFGSLKRMTPRATLLTSARPRMKRLIAWLLWYNRPGFAFNAGIYVKPDAIRKQMACQGK
jgi:transposase InsO family protein